jgi:hypothetical protein
MMRSSSTARATAWMRNAVKERSSPDASRCRSSRRAFVTSISTRPWMMFFRLAAERRSVYALRILRNGRVWYPRPGAVRVASSPVVVGCSARVLVNELPLSGPPRRFVARSKSSSTCTHHRCSRRVGTPETSDQPQTGSAQDNHRTGRVRDDVLAHRAQQHSGETPAAAGPDHDQVGPL